MSGHSKWAKIKRAKGANDAKRSALFTKLARNITVAAQEGGGDPDMNFTLRLAIDKAKQANMPLDNIDRSVKKGTGESKDGGKIEKITYEFITNFGVNGLVDCATDNTNRTVSEIRNTIETAGHKMAEPGSVSWGFSEEGLIEVGVAQLQKSEKYGEEDKYVNADLEELEMLLLEIDGILDYEVYDPADIEEFEEEDNRPKDRKYINVKTEKEALKAVTGKLAENDWQILESEIVKTASNKITLDDDAKAKLDSLIEKLEENDDVDNIWTNANDY